jgi:nucleotide-binding universal stress UspA family protein
VSTSPIARIVLATDLGPRCDRAAQRAVSLARQWRATLHVLTVLEIPSRNASADNDAAVAQARKLAAESLGDFRANVSVLKGAVGESIAANADELLADLTGPSGSDWFGQAMLGPTTATLMRHGRSPVLVVKTPGHAPYRRVVAALDLSDASRAPVEAATRMFGDMPFAIFHAFSTPFRMFAGDVGTYEAGIRAGVTGEIRDALKAWSIPAASEIPVIAEYGDPASTLVQYAEKTNTDLIVIGSHGRTGLLNFVLGSVAEAIVESAKCDVLVVPSRRGLAGLGTGPELDSLA